MGVDTGIKVPAVAYIAGQSARFSGNGREMRYKRRKFYARRKKLQRFKKKKSVKRTKHKENRWMKDVNHKISRKIVNYAHSQGVATNAMDKKRILHKNMHFIEIFILSGTSTKPLEETVSVPYVRVCGPHHEYRKH